VSDRDAYMYSKSFSILSSLDLLFLSWSVVFSVVSSLSISNSGRSCFSFLFKHNKYVWSGGAPPILYGGWLC